MTIAWLNAAALAALAVVGLPILIHLLLRRRARRLPFPTVRFFVADTASALRPRLPEDAWLLLVRIAIVACAALAVARPLWISEARRAAWAEHTVRAIVVDTTSSVNRGEAENAARAETRSAPSARRFDDHDLRGAVRRAAAWLSAAGPGLREIVVVSDFQRGALERGDLATVPREIGLRVVQVPLQPPDRAFEGAAVWKGGASLTPHVIADESGTEVTWRPGTFTTSGLTIAAPPEIASKLIAVVADAGALAPSVEAPVTVRFDTAIPPDSLAAASALQNALNARWDANGLAEREPSVIAAAELQTWMRAPGMPPADAWRQGDESDGRWLWLAALVLLGLEHVLRRAPAADAPARDARAA